MKNRERASARMNNGQSPTNGVVAVLVKVIVDVGVGANTDTSRSCLRSKCSSSCSKDSLSRLNTEKNREKKVGRMGRIGESRPLVNKSPISVVSSLSPLSAPFKQRLRLAEKPVETSTRKWIWCLCCGLYIYLYLHGKNCCSKTRMRSYRLYPGRGSKSAYGNGRARRI